MVHQINYIIDKILTIELTNWIRCELNLVCSNSLLSHLSPRLDKLKCLCHWFLTCENSDRSPMSFSSPRTDRQTGFASPAPVTSSVNSEQTSCQLSLLETFFFLLFFLKLRIYRKWEPAGEMSWQRYICSRRRGMCIHKNGMSKGWVFIFNIIFFCREKY